MSWSHFKISIVGSLGVQIFNNVVCIYSERALAFFYFRFHDGDTPPFFSITFSHYTSLSYSTHYPQGTGFAGDFCLSSGIFTLPGGSLPRGPSVTCSGQIRGTQHCHALYEGSSIGRRTQSDALYY